MLDSLESLKRILSAWEGKKTMLAIQSTLKKVTRREGPVLAYRQEEPALMPNKQESLMRRPKTFEGPEAMPDSQEGLKIVPKRREELGMASDNQE